MDISFIKDIFGELENRFNIDSATLCEENGSHIYYMNGNDGTDFDFDANSCSCEFMSFYRSSEMGAVQLRLTRAGIEWYYYSETEHPLFPMAEGLEACDGFSGGMDALADICGYLKGSLDDQNIWNKAITEWELAEYASV